MTGLAPVRLLILLAAACAAGAADQQPELIVIDPNHPLIQEPGTLRPVGPSEAARPGGGAGETPEVVPLQPPGVNAREILSGLWFRYRALVQSGDGDGAARQITTALAFMKREGLRASPEIAGALLAEGGRGMEAGDYRRAREQDSLAVRFAPLMPQAHFALASVLLRGDRDPAGAAREWWAGIRAVLSDPESLYDLAGNVLLILFLALGAGATLTLVIVGVKSAPILVHDLQERTSGRLSDEGARLLGFAILALPALVMLPVVGILAFWAVLLFPYLRPSERAVASVALLFLLAGGPAIHLLEWHFGTAADPGARALIRSVREGPDLQQEEALKGLMKDHAGEAIFPFLLASAYRAGGRFDEAIDLYRRTLEIDPTNARAMVNLGNLHALRQEFAVAQTFYKKAAETDPLMALAHYDSHLAHLEMFHLEAADAELKDARRLDDALIGELLAEGDGGRGKRAPRDAVYTQHEIWRRAMRLRLEGSVRREAARALTAPASLAGGAGLLGVLLWPGIGLASRTGGARRCRRCGRAFCRRCQVTTKYPDFCSQCMHLFILRDGLAPGVKAKKMDDVARYRRRVFIGSRLLSLFLPGGGHVLAGRAIFGAVLITGWAAAWLGIALHDELMVNLEGLARQAIPATFFPLALLALLAWLLGNLTSHEASAD